MAAWSSHKRNQSPKIGHSNRLDELIEQMYASRLMPTRLKTRPSAHLGRQGICRHGRNRQYRARLVRYRLHTLAVIQGTSFPHESRDPIHHFIGFTGEERKVIDSRPIQRLRQIHQLSTTPLVYPGASHTRFEHSLGVMHLASKIYDVITDPEHLLSPVREVLPQLHDQQRLLHWKAILRMAALCHDIGHLPFSHGAEGLLPKGWTHERLSYELILSDEMRPVWESHDPYLKPELIAKLAIGVEDVHEFAPEVTFNDWETLLSEIIIGPFFGADRMDYLLRDSYHAGVAYGHFDHFRLIATLRILPPPPERVAGDEQSWEPSLGVQHGGLQSAEAMMLARFFMFSQVYYHPTRLIYDVHLFEFLKEWLKGGTFPTGLQQHLSLTDNEVMVALLAASRDPRAVGHIAAEAIVQRRHYRVFSQGVPAEQEFYRPAQQVYDAACLVFGADKVKHAWQQHKVKSIDYPVLMRKNTIVSSASLSVVQLETQDYEYAFISPELRNEAEDWLTKNRAKAITRK